MANRIAIVLTIFLGIGLVQSYWSAQAIHAGVEDLNRELEQLIEQVERMTDEVNQTGRPKRPDFSSILAPHSLHPAGSLTWLASRPEHCAQHLVCRQFDWEQATGLQLSVRDYSRPLSASFE